MIKTHSEDPSVAAAAAAALIIINDALSNLPLATSFDYGGHQLNLGDYNVCTTCTQPIAEAQQAYLSLEERIESEPNTTIKEHLVVATELLQHEADAAVVRAELHNGQGTEPILNALLGFLYDRKVGDSYDHTHASVEAK